MIDEHWDKPPTAVRTEADDAPEQTAVLEGTVTIVDSEDVIQGASVAVQAAPNDQRGPILTDSNGHFRFERLPLDTVTVVVTGPGFRRRQMQVEILDGQVTAVEVELKPAGEGRRRKIAVKNLQVEIADEATFIVEGHSEPMTLHEYIDYTKTKVRDLTGSWQELLEAWQEDEQRREMLDRLAGASVYPDVLAEVLERSEVDEVDILGHIAYQRELRTRYDRTLALRQTNRAWLDGYDQPAREVLYALLNKYELGGVRQLSDPRIFRVPPFRQMGEVRGVVRRFGGDAQQLRNTLDELQRRLYAV